MPERRAKSAAARRAKQGKAGAEMGQALADALALLRALPRERHGMRAAQGRFADFKAAHPGLPCRLLIDEKPGADAVDFDVLLTIDGAGAGAGAGTVALSWHGDD